jgi:hypothetical protein
MSDFQWDRNFSDLFERCAARYRGGDDDFNGYYTLADRAFLAAIGCKPRELFDFVEDWIDGGEPAPTTALMVAAVRRDFFLHVQQGVASSREMRESELPARDATLAGIAWLPRILQKARNKLRGENHPDIMFCCGGDRRFLREHGVHPADFLRVVWAAKDDDAKVVEFVKSRRG